DFIAGEVEEPGEADEVRFVGPARAFAHPFRQSFLGLFDWGGRFTNNVNYSARLSYRVNDNINTSLSFTGSQFWQDTYNHFWKFLPERSTQIEGRSSNYVFSWNHTLNTKSFYSVRLGFLDNFRFTYAGMRNGVRLLPDAMNNSVSEDEDILRNYSGAPRAFTDEELEPIDSFDERQGRRDPRSGYNKSGFGDDWAKHTTQIFTLKFDYLNQVNRNNELKFGFEWKYNDLHQEQINNGDNKVPSRRINPPDAGPFITSGSIRDFYDRFPNTGSAYIQDKIEFESLIINAGLRFDRFDPGAQVFEAGEAFLTEDVEKERVNTKNYLSPRLGLSHPITDRSRLYFFYGRFVQMPTLRELFRRQNRFRVFQNQLNIFGNPDLEAEETISYEIGFDQQLTDNLKIGVTGFFKDIRNQINSEIFGPDAATFRKIVNRDFGQDRGFEFDVVKRFSNYYSANINYTLMWATTRASTVNRGTGTTQIRYGNLQEVPSSWDQRHTVNANVRFELPAGRGFRLFGTTIDRLSLTAFWRYGSGQPFTLDSDVDPNRLVNDERLPFFSELDLRLRKDFKLTGNIFAQFYLDIENLFNRRNVLFLLGDEDHRCIECEIEDPVTGEVRTVTFENGNPEGDGTPRDLDPEQFGPPRQILFGFGLRF
ncbi:MAG: TonB-dependent receptor plug domain-containing protein, partial [bacterium]